MGFILSILKCHGSLFTIEKKNIKTEWKLCNRTTSFYIYSIFRLVQFHLIGDFRGNAIKYMFSRSIVFRYCHVNDANQMFECGYILNNIENFKWNFIDFCFVRFVDLNKVISFFFCKSLKMKRIAILSCFLQNELLFLSSFSMRFQGRYFISKNFKF